MRSATTNPSPEIVIKIRRACNAVAAQKQRSIYCPYCKCKTIVVYEDTRGHVQAKCKHCGAETVYNVLSMRRQRRA